MSRHEWRSMGILCNLLLKFESFFFCCCSLCRLDAFHITIRNGLITIMHFDSVQSKQSAHRRARHLVGSNAHIFCLLKEMPFRYMYIRTQTRTHQYTHQQSVPSIRFCETTYTHTHGYDTLKTLCACTISIRHTHTHHTYTQSQVYVHVTSRRICCLCMGICECVYRNFSEVGKAFVKGKKIDFALLLTIKFLNSI